MSESTLDSAPILPVVLDAMGGDRAPAVVVEGAVRACHEGLGPIVLTGPRERIESSLTELDAGILPIEIVDAPDIISMSDHPIRAAKAKRESSIHRGLGLVKSGEAAAFVSAGNSGAVMAVGLFALGRLERCDRPALATGLPTPGRTTVFLDVGASIECRAAHLVQFALMGAAYAQRCLDVERPSVTLLSNGLEPSKGTETLRETHRLLNQTDLRYEGFIEGRDLPLGPSDVVVCDGLVGNIVLKLSEALVSSLFDRLRGAIRDDFLATLAVPFVKGPLTRLKEELDWERVGGAALLGLNGVVVVAHGNASPRAIVSAIRRARNYHRLGLVQAIGAALTNHAPDEQVSTAELPINRASDEFERDD